ncbi:DUF1501 domain-containing protein [Blastopirellula marina]|uniref:DUF1501 domain-containing protein n=1 Tax=Blastopirellula marina TaxID=124 RepID=A0A2S8FF21_9BACT|nr:MULTISPECIES: DUF1501 domain-containing protein [Pirellulaceae]PQO30759.1 DUF1501 domain-containing protein [Blastopirellula marina]RCS50896.1 DUF1501 domain-containing protein [Bremerella cremea]
MHSRRAFLRSSVSGFGYLAFAALAHQQAAHAADAVTNPLASKETHFEPRAKRVIFLCMEGGPSHLDTFDYKPQLLADDGKPTPRNQGGGRGGKLLGSPFRFKQHGESGLWVSELFSDVATHADKLCVLNGMHTNLPAHAQAFLQLHCGIFQFSRPSLGAWVLYGLGTENTDLPGFVSINPPRNNGGAANYGASFLPAMYQGTRISRRGFRAGETISNLKNERRSSDAQRAQLDFIQTLNRSTAESLGGSPEIDGLISSYELAFRMQSEMPEVLDISNETASTLKMYGIEQQAGGQGRRPGMFGGGGAGPSAGGTDTFGRQCLLARRMVEAGVRFVEVTMGGWDHHLNLEESLRGSCGSVDRPIAGLLADLQQRGLLKDTLVLWGGEFGRSPYAQGDGRDHNNKGFSMWMAGGGIKGGYVHGATDEYGYEAVDGRVHIHDWHATILHLLGLDHERLTYRYAGRDMRLTDVKGHVVNDIIA